MIQALTIDTFIVLIFDDELGFCVAGFKCLCFVVARRGLTECGADRNSRTCQMSSSASKMEVGSVPRENEFSAMAPMLAVSLAQTAWMILSYVYSANGEL